MWFSGWKTLESEQFDRRRSKKILYCKSEAAVKGYIT